MILESDFLTAVERKAGTLTSPFASAPRIRVASYFLAFHPDQSARPATRKFTDWIRASVPKPNRPRVGATAASRGQS